MIALCACVSYISLVNTCILLGTVCNVSKKIESDLEIVLKSLSYFDSVRIFLVESDSSDSTIDVLDSIKSNNPNFDYRSLGQLRNDFPDRIERIRFSRNEYIQYIRSLNASEMPDYVIIADLDGMNGKLTENAIQSCFVRSDWDAVFSNQLGGYYDILALRHDIWQPMDYNLELAWYRSLVTPKRPNYPGFYESLRLRLDYDRARYLAIYRKMLRFEITQPWIEVNSAFGGIGIYKPEVFLKYDYSPDFESGGGSSEHVSLHSKMRRDGLKLFINPSFINGGWNTYNINRFLLIRQARQLMWNSKSMSKALGFMRKLLQKS